MAWTWLVIAADGVVVEVVVAAATPASIQRETAQRQHGINLVAQWLGRWIRDREVASSTPGGCVSE